MNEQETKFDQILSLLHKAGIKFIVIGGVAAIGQGNTRATFDVDVVYSRDRENIKRLVEALAPHKPYLRGAPPGLPFVWDEKTVRMGLNFNLTTTLGNLDMLGEVVGGGNYSQLLPESEQLVIFGVPCRCTPLESNPIETRGWAAQRPYRPRRAAGAAGRTAQERPAKAWRL